MRSRNKSSDIEGRALCANVSVACRSRNNAHTQLSPIRPDLKEITSGLIPFLFRHRHRRFDKYRGVRAVFRHKDSLLNPTDRPITQTERKERKKNPPPFRDHER